MYIINYHISKQNVLSHITIRLIYRMCRALKLISLLAENQLAKEDSIKGKKVPPEYCPN